VLEHRVAAHFVGAVNQLTLVLAHFAAALPAVLLVQPPAELVGFAARVVVFFAAALERVAVPVDLVVELVADAAARVGPVLEQLAVALVAGTVVGRAASVLEQHVVVLAEPVELLGLRVVEPAAELVAELVGRVAELVVEPVVEPAARVVELPAHVVDPAMVSTLPAAVLLQIDRRIVS